MAGQSEMALAKDESQRKTTKTKKKRSTTGKKSSSGASRKKSASSRRAKQAESGGLPIMKLRAIDIVDGSGTQAAGPDKVKDQDNEQPQVIHMPPPAVGETDAVEETRETPAVAQSAEGVEAETEEHANENQVSDPELLELLEQLSVTIDTANEVLDAAVNVPQDASHPQMQAPNDEPPSETDDTIQMQQSQSPEPQFDRLADRLSGMNQEKDDLRPLAERFASTPNTGETGRAKRGKFRIVANAALTGLIVAAGVGWLAYTNPWILEGGSDAAAPAPTVTPEPEQAATVKPQQTAAAETEAAKDQTQLADERAPLPGAEAKPTPKTETESVTPAVAPPTAVAPAPVTPKPALSALTPPESDPVPMESVAKEPVTPTVLKPVRGTAGDKIALNIGLPADAGSAEMSIMVQSVPTQTKLSAGKDLGSGNWLLTTGQLDGLTLNTKSDLQPGEYQVEVIMVRSDGKVPDARKVAVLVEAPKPPAPAPVKPAPVKAPPKKQIVEPKPADAATTAAISKPDAPVVRKPEAPAVVEPKPAPPAAAQTTLPPLSKKQVSNILKRGDALLREGDVSGARLLLGYAAARGHTEAMEKLAKSYDPAHLATLGVRGVEPDAEKAAHWYERARKTATAQ